VYVVGADNRVKMTPFQAGERIGHFYIVASGLKLHDQVVYEGTQSLKDGDTIQPQAISKQDKK